MNKFLVTGLRRSGTTMISSILNTNQNISCIEYPLMSSKDIKTPRELNIYNSNVWGNFIFFDMKPPLAKKIPLKKEELINNFLKSLSNHYKVDFVGFKQTQLSLKQIIEAIKLGFKVIITRRDIEDVYKSAINRFYSDEFFLACEIKNYLKDINYFKFDTDISNNILIIDYKDVLTNKEKIEKKLSNFLCSEIKILDDLYYSFNKNLRYSNKNSSFYFKSELNKKNLDHIKFLHGHKNIYFFKYLAIEALKKFKVNLKKILKPLK